MQVTEGEFDGTDRFAIVRRLGQGGMGVVYEALDRTYGGHVALKTLRRFDARTILGFKKEFRALEELQHPNLVQLGELVEERGRWFFTMELVRGVDFISHVRPMETSPLDEARLRAGLSQLARGLVALHAADKVHRDVKPSNIIVTQAGRVVLLDFGLVTDATALARSTDELLRGTVGYMSPEQAGMGRVGLESDWYAVGVLLYFALTARLPFDGVPADILMRKQRETPLPPREIDPSIAADLDALCIDLLSIDPPRRPTGPDLLRRLAAGGDRKKASMPPPTTRASFVGRHSELAELRMSFEASRAGTPSAVRVVGESGVGKSALVRRFASAAAADGALVLAGRCYERELVPYKAIDGVVDALCHELARLPDDEACALLPASAWLLPQLFPVLGRLEALEAPSSARANPEPREARARSFAALRELLVNVARAYPLVIAIDDLQWADADSLALLAEILRPPDAPSMLLVCTARDDVANARAASDLPFAVRDISLAPLGRNEAVELATALIARTGMAATMSADAIAQEGAGHPLFIAELVRHARRGHKGEVLLDDALYGRVAGLDEMSRRLVELVAIAGAPLALSTAARALEVERGKLGACVPRLRADNLVRTARGGGLDRVEAYHDRVREAVLARLDADQRRAWHERLALALEVAGDADAEALAVHWREAGATEKAARWALAAANEAVESLAFQRAAALGMLALELVPIDHADAQRARLIAADALANAGRGRDAATHYLAAATRAAPSDAIDLRRHAAEQLLRSGHIDEGLDAMSDVLASVGLSLPRTPRRAVASLVWNQARLVARGEHFTVRAAESIAPEVLRRVDVCWSVTLGLSFVDIVCAADFQARNLRYALDAGEPGRLARSFAIAANFASHTGGRSRERATRLMTGAKQLAERHPDPYTLAWLVLARAAESFSEGRWRACLVACDEANVAFRSMANVAWERASAEAFSLYALGFLGDLRELGRRVEAAHRDAIDRGDLYAAMNVRTGSSHYVRLAADDPDASRRESSDAVRSWSRRGFHMQHLLDLFTQTETDLYAGDAASALTRLRTAWDDVEASLLLRMHVNRVIMNDLFARTELAVAKTATRATQRSLMISVERRATKLETEAMGWSSAMACALRAGVASTRGDRAGADALYMRAASALDAESMTLHAAAARSRAAEMVGDGRARNVALAPFRDEGVRAPDRFAAMLTP